MKLITDFDPSAAPNGIIETKGVNKDEQLMLYNDSPIGFKLEFPDGSYDIMPPSWNKDFIIKTVAMDKVKWSFYNRLVATNWPISQVYGTIYEPGEHVASVNAAMQRGVTSTGGTVTSVGSTLSNEGGAVGTEVIDIGTTANPKLIDIFNDHWILSIEIAGVKHTILQGSLTGNPAQLGMAGDRASFLGTMIEFLNAAYVNATVGDFIFNIQTGNTFRFRINNADVVSIDSAGFNVLNASLNLQSGRLQRQKNGHAVGINGVVVTHGVGATPQIVLICTDIAQAGSGTVGVGNVGSTTFTATCGAGTGFWWMCSNG